MINENEHQPGSLQDNLQKPDPSGPNGTATAPTGPAITRCNPCDREVIPEVLANGRSACPHCHKWLAVARQPEGVRTKRVEEIYAEFVAEYEPISLVIKFACRDLAVIREKLERTKAGSTEWQRLSSRSEALTVVLEDWRRSRVQPPLDFDGMTHAQVADELEALAAQARGVANAAGRLAGLDKPDAARPLPPGTARRHAPIRTGDRACAPGTGHSGEHRPETDAPHAEPDCEFCRRSPCVGPTHHAFAVLHVDDPLEVYKRNDAELVARERSAALRGSLNDF